MSQLGHIEEEITDEDGNALVSANLALYREGATVSGNQAGTAPFTVTVRSRGKIAAGDSVFVNSATDTTYTVTSVTATTVVLSGFGGTLNLNNLNRLTPINDQPTLYSDDHGGATTPNPLVSSSTGLAEGYAVPGVYDRVLSGGGGTTRHFPGLVVSSAPIYADAFGAFNVLEFGAKGDNSTDDTAAIQDAINAAAAAGGRVVFPGGRTYKHASTITWKRGVSFEGLQGKATVAGTYPKLEWSGSAGGTMFTTEASGGNQGQFDISRLILGGSGSNNPGTIINFTERVDLGLALSKVGLQNCSGDAMSFDDGIINMHCYDVRFDGIAGWVFKVENSGDKDARLLTIDKFTYDTGTGTAKGLIYIDGSTSPNNARTWIGLSNGSIEVNTNLAGSDDAIVLLGVNTSISDVVQFYVNLDNVQCHTAVGKDAYALVKSTPTSDQIVVVGVNTYMLGDNLSKVLVGGTTTAGPEAGKHFPFFCFAPFVDGAPAANNNRSAFTGNVQLVNGRIYSDLVTFASADTTPSVKRSNVFKTANGSSTAISAFDDGRIGQEIHVIIGDANTTIDFTGTTLKGNAGADWTPTTNDSMICVYDGTNWYCRISDNTA